jgi:hypothetical protein
MNNGKTVSWQVAALAGLLPILSVNLAFVLNVHAGMDGCFPYWDGCVSVSRGVRTGPGLVLFKVLSLPGALMMAWCWRQLGPWLQDVADPGSRRRQTITWLGTVGAAFLLVYAAALGTEGELYRWMRRYGVVFYFGLTGLAQLFTVAALWRRRLAARAGRLRGPILVFCGTVFLSWGLGVASALKRKLIDDPEFLDRVENALEWDFELALSLAFVALAWLLRKDRFTVAP